MNTYYPLTQERIEQLEEIGFHRISLIMIFFSLLAGTSTSSLMGSYLSFDDVVSKADPTGNLVSG